MNLPDPPSPAGPERPSDAAQGPEPAPAARPGPGGMRASDADRDKVADRLREALADGRITAEEHAERIDAVYKAKTYAELEPVLADLPGGGGPAPSAPVDAAGRAPAAPPRTEPGTAVAILTETKRAGRWLVEPQSHANVLLGKVMLDLRQAVLSQREVTINCSCVLGEVEIIVPPGVRVLCSATAVLGQVEIPFDDPEDPDPPTVRITGFTLLGQIGVRRRAVGEASLSERVKQIAEERVHDHLLGHERRREAVRDAREQHRRAVEEAREERIRSRDQRREHLRELRDERRRHRH
ncbi:DUF1707 SHOCT-like domain-containing protein [Actinomadura rupiterrae]|uniref:DUF1707 SHOCT-like domain-containing protein n=1 Tax=Actinomadura rupiterrae TaxID=559627 RepID=UPI0020A4D53D|nr:DUF1707 domain-containing protein [Actinomadura rupiterrae]MCP2338280.1 putative membrane protein [Actinomadura rupiterrae]